MKDLAGATRNSNTFKRTRFAFRQTPTNASKAVYQRARAPCEERPKMAREEG